MGRRIKIIALFVMVVCIILVLFLELNHTSVRFPMGKIDMSPKKSVLTETNIKLTYDSESRTSFCTTSNGFFYCTRDGIQFYKNAGDFVWNDTFTTASPIMVGDENVVAVSESNGKFIAVYNEAGQLYKVDSEFPVIQFSVNKLGYSSVISKNNDSYFIKNYNSKGEELPARKEEVQNITPLSSDISDDGRVLAVSYIDTNSTQMETKISFFYLNEKESMDYVDKMFASKVKENQITPIIKFMENNNLICISDSEIYCIDGTGNEKWTKQMTNRIDQISFADNNYFVIALGEPIANKDSEPMGTVKWYDLDGNNFNKFELGRQVTYLHSDFNNTIIGSFKLFKEVTKKGKVLFEYASASDLKQMLLMKGGTKVLSVGVNEAVILNLEKQHLSPPEGAEQQNEGAESTEQPKE